MSKKELLAIIAIVVLAAYFSRPSPDRQPVLPSSAVSWVMEEVDAHGYQAERFKEIYQRVGGFTTDEFVITKFSRRQDFYSWEIIGNMRAEAYFLEAKSLTDPGGRLSHSDLGEGSKELFDRLTELKRSLKSRSSPSWMKVLSANRATQLNSPWYLLITDATVTRVFCIDVKDGKNEELINRISTPRETL